MIKVWFALVWLFSSQLCWALSPYFQGAPVKAQDLPSVVKGVSVRLQAAGFSVIGHYSPQGIGGGTVLVAVDKSFLGSIKRLGGASIVAAPIRVGVRPDGAVIYENVEYWARAYLRKKYTLVDKTVKELQARLDRAMGKRRPFGGDVEREDLADYQYMFGMEGFESDKNLLMEHLTFEDAVQTVRENLARSAAKTSKVYELVVPEKKVAVFGVAMNDPKEGEGWWVNTIGADNIAALPYEIYIVDNKVNHLFARFRIALGWPNVGMGTFMRIVDAPGIIRDTLSVVAGSAPER